MYGYENVTLNLMGDHMSLSTVLGEIQVLSGNHILSLGQWHFICKCKIFSQIICTNVYDKSKTFYWHRNIWRSYD